MKIEHLQKTVDDLGFACESLQASIEDANAVEYIVILDCLDAAHKLHRKVSQLLNAMREG